MSAITRSFAFLAGTVLITVAVAYGGAESAQFAGTVRPILQARCSRCHRPEMKTSGFSVADEESVIRGGNRQGPAVLGGDPAHSPLLRLVRGELQPRMPMGGTLSPTEISAIEEWVRTLAPSKAQGAATAWTWPWRVQVKPPVPTVANAEWERNPIDAFVLQKLGEKGQRPASAAPRPVLARRLYLDLIGMPPTPEELKGYLDDAAPNATESLVDRLLADPRYGKRWARYWLDLVRYSDSNGLEADPEIGNDLGFGNVWRYRDWVIGAFTADLPYDRFIEMQIAGGDEKSRRRDKYTLGMRGYVPAVHYRLGVWSLYDNIVSIENRQAFLDEITNTTASAFLGITLGCARCHDHKYDPFPSRDYYRLEAFFNTLKADDIEAPYHDPDMREKAGRRIRELTERLATGPEKKAFESLQAELLDHLKVQLKEAAQKNAGQKLTTQDLQLELRRKENKVFTAQERLRYTDLSEDADRTKDLEETNALRASEKELLNKLEAAYVDQLGPDDLRKEMPESDKPPRLFTIAERDHYFVLRDQVRTIENRLRRWKPVLATAVNVPGPPTEADIQPLHVLTGGDVYRPGEAVQPGLPVALGGDGKPAKLELDEFHQYPTRGWRTTLAHWLASRDNPLTARVMVNRIWSGHFGRGIVPTLNDFGTNGERPTHPELLDWLAVTFMEQGWSIKTMHRLILNSATYQQAADGPAENLERDPGNVLLSRYNRRRLDAEAMRDSILSVFGRLNPERGGPGVFPPLPAEMSDAGRSIPIGGIMWESNEQESDGRKRSIYTFERRSLPHPFLAAFDGTVPNESCERRGSTTTSLQALTMMNGAFVNEEAAHLAARAQKEAGPDRGKQVRRVFELALSRTPSPQELDRFLTFRGSLDAICRVILSSNEFAYIE
jgi:mono/diheme cytochrome c family protein